MILVIHYFSQSKQILYNKCKFVTDNVVRPSYVFVDFILIFLTLKSATGSILRNIHKIMALSCLKYIQISIKMYNKINNRHYKNYKITNIFTFNWYKLHRKYLF